MIMMSRATTIQDAMLEHTSTDTNHTTILSPGYRIASRVSIDVTLLPRMTCLHAVMLTIDESARRKRCTHNCPDGVLLCRSRLLRRVIKHEVEEEVVSAQYSAHFAAALEIYEQFLVHKLERSGRAVSKKPRRVMRGSAPFSTLAAMPWT